MATAATALQGSSGRSVEEAVSYAVGHRIRIEILAALHEGPASSTQLARTLRQPQGNVGYHIGELLATGSIEVAEVQKVGNVDQHIYRAVELPEYTSEEFTEMTEVERRVVLALILQASMAEALASLWAGKMTSDPAVMFAWNRVTLDEEGRAELAKEQDESWLRIRDIEARAASRRGGSGDQGATYVVTSFGYPRSRNEAPEPISNP